MSEGPSAAAREPTAMTSLPRVEDLPAADHGLEENAVRQAFDSFRRHVVQLQAQLRVLQAAGRTAQVDPTGHAVRMDALHLIREAAEFADVLERDAQRASAGQLQKTEQEVRQRQQDIQEREAELQRFREESERQRNEILTAARNEARQVQSDATRDSTKELREAEARGARLPTPPRHQATELTNATRAEVEQTLEWARGQASTIIARAQQGAEQLLSAAGLGEARANEIADEIAKSAESVAQSARVAEVQPEKSKDTAAGAQPLRAAPTPAKGKASEPEAPSEPAGDSDDS